jgi:hypothetical protein
MNKNIEELIKEALENHDSGYVSGAWESMQARLDGTPSTPFYKKWWVAAAFGTALVGSATYFMLNSNDVTEQSTAVVENTTDSDKEAVNTTENKTTYNSNTDSQENPAADQTAQNPFTEKIMYSGNGGTSVSFGSSIRKPHTTPQVFPIISNAQNPNEINLNTNETLQYKQLSLPKSICLGEEISIVNTNDILNIVVIEPSGRKMVVAGGKTAVVNVSESGTIRVISGTTEDVIAIQENKTDLYIDVDASLLFENGIPSIKFKVPGETNLNWSSDIKGAEVKGDTYIVHPYTQKEVTVSVSSTNEFGCTTTEKQTISINEPYNLLAAKGLNTNSPDVRNRTFMPYALTQRTNVSFELIIIDPRNGAIVYSTSDASEAWDGIDKRTGEMVKQNTVWPWRVLMKNPNPGEPKEYSGTITIL